MFLDNLGGFDMIISLLSLLSTFKIMRFLFAIGFILPFVYIISNFIVSNFSNFVMPREFLLIWNFFDMNSNVSMLLSAMSSVYVYRFVYDFLKRLI